MATDYESVNFLASLFSSVMFFVILSIILYFCFAVIFMPNSQSIVKIPESLDRAVENYIGKNIMPNPYEQEQRHQSVVAHLELEEPTPEPKKPELDKQKLKDYSDILKAIGFNATEAKSKVKSLLTDNPNLTQEELLRKATQ